MKKIPSKRDIRQQIEQQMLEYLEQGGEVAEIKHGVSGYEHNQPPPAALFQQPRANRTPVADVVKELEARRQPNKTRTAASKPKATQKIAVYDDFGEIVRWVWPED